MVVSRKELNWSKGLAESFISLHTTPIQVMKMSEYKHWLYLVQIHVILTQKYGL